MKNFQFKLLATICCIILSVSALVVVAERRQDDFKAKNLQLLPKDIKYADLKKIMDGYCAALNVKCGFCHVRNKDTNEWDYASDAKSHKKDSREMIKLTREINQKYFEVGPAQEEKFAVTCYTCHRGDEHPEVLPPNTPVDTVGVKIQ
jgi:hypothetical protein